MFWNLSVTPKYNLVGAVGGVVDSVLDYCSDDPSSLTTKFFSIIVFFTVIVLYWEKTKINEKETGKGPSLKKTIENLLWKFFENEPKFTIEIFWKLLRLKFCYTLL